MCPLKGAGLTQGGDQAQLMEVRGLANSSESRVGDQAGPSPVDKNEGLGLAQGLSVNVKVWGLAHSLLMKARDWG